MADWDTTLPFLGDLPRPEGEGYYLSPAVVANVDNDMRIAREEIFGPVAAALVVDGNIVAAAQEERFSRKKHDARVPVNAIRYCLEAAGLKRGDQDRPFFRRAAHARRPQRL